MTLMHMQAISVRQVLASLFGNLILLWEKFKGRKTVFEHVIVSKCFSQKLVGYAVAGYEITIYCQKREYRRVYKRKWIPTSSNYMYQVFGVVSNDAPELLKKACEHHICIPAFLSTSVHEEYQEHEAIQAYLDIITARLGVNDMSI